MHSGLKMWKCEINWLPQSLKIILNFYFKQLLIAFYEANSSTSFPKIFAIFCWFLEHYALWKADNMMMIMMMHAQAFAKKYTSSYANQPKSQRENSRG